MSTEIFVAVLGVVATLAAAGLSAVYGPAWKLRLDRKQEALAAVRRYRDPLLRAAFDLQSRIYNIVRLDFLQAYAGEEKATREYALSSTLWLFAQYMGWVEILRREVQFLDMGGVRESAALQQQLFTIASIFATDVDPSSFRIFRSDQRALGEVMITARDDGETGKRTDCLGYAEFTKKLQDPESWAWFEPLRDDLIAMSGEPSLRGHTRLVRVQRALVTLIDLQDPHRLRFPDLDTRGYLPQVGETPDLPHDSIGWRVARFVMRGDEGDGDYLAEYRGWAAAHDLTPDRDANMHVAKRVGIAGVRLEVWAISSDTLPGWCRIEIRALLRPSQGWSRLGLEAPVPVDTNALRLRAARREAAPLVNDLLRRYHRPLIMSGRGARAGRRA